MRGNSVTGAKVRAVKTGFNRIQLLIIAASFGILAAVAIAVVVIPRYQNSDLCEGHPAHLGCLRQLQPVLPGPFADGKSPSQASGGLCYAARPQLLSDTDRK